ncbi:MAG: hypothetical protein K2X56_18485 [Mycobacterium pseudokansasii]|uniref:hypothetical protein n=1 Tax=Mycobacterium pseudokansasii TaxID=2341080 RepID=UPI0004B85A27|nr:hypothetical protein [Mycobacterium pseudokansasii]MBY0390015.1 hypothetical protein [Mycobacterium pseudokansasii]
MARWTGRPGPLCTGDILRAATMINEPLRRWRTVGDGAQRWTPPAGTGRPHAIAGTG